MCLCYSVFCCAVSHCCSLVLAYFVAVAAVGDSNYTCSDCAVLRCAVLCCAVLCCAVLCCAVLCCAVLYCAVLCCAVLWCAVVCCAVLCCAVLCCAVRLCGFAEPSGRGVMHELGHTGPIRPVHLREAYRRVVAQGKVPGLATPEASFLRRKL